MSRACAIAAVRRCAFARSGLSLWSRRIALMRRTVSRSIELVESTPGPAWDAPQYAGAAEAGSGAEGTAMASVIRPTANWGRRFVTGGMLNIAPLTLGHSGGPANMYP